MYARPSTRGCCLFHLPEVHAPGAEIRSRIPVRKAHGRRMNRRPYQTVIRLQASVGSCARAGLAFALAGARVLTGKGLFDVFSSTLPHFMGIAKTLIADFVRPLAEHLVFTPGPGQKRTDQETRSETDQPHHDRVLCSIGLHAVEALP